MDNSTESQDFEVTVSNEPVVAKVDSKTEERKPIQPNPRSFDIQSPRSQASHIIYAGNVDAWERISAEKTRQIVAFCIISLFTAWVLLGLVIFAITGNAWLLGSAGILALPLKYVFDYYFHRSKK